MKKTRVTVATNNGFKEVDGYKVDVIYKGIPYDIAVNRQWNDPTRWMLTELNTGLSIAVLYKTRKDAVDCINIECMEHIDRLARTERYKIAQKAMADYKEIRNIKANR